MTRARHTKLKAGIDSLVAGPVKHEEGDISDVDDEGYPAPVVVDPTAFNTKNEIIPIPKLPTIAKVEDDEELEPVGEVMSIVGTVVIVKAYQDGSNRVLDTDSMLVFEDRKVLGLVSNTILNSVSFHLML
jgi:H/ACA ribonucleoprotein complex non-core subunit NAF1